MKTLLKSTLVALALAIGCNKQGSSPRAWAGSQPTPPTFSSFDPPGGTNAVASRTIVFANADIDQVFALYQELSGRSVIRWPNVPNVKISFENTRAMTRAEALQALDTVMAAQNVVMIYLGTRYVKAVPAAQAPQEAGPLMEIPWEELPDSSSFLTYIAPLKHIKAEEATSLLQPFAKFPNSIIGVRGYGVIFLRDYSSNIRRMMEMLEMADKPGTNFWKLPGKK
jgi:type II secretory pathway component GspD/PulD (secretin)